MITTRMKKESERRPIPFWSWNDQLDETELIRQIHWMHEKGIGGFFMHARGGLQTEYLSDEWMQKIARCCREAKKLGMEAWVYDENGWPSGFAGGKLLADPGDRDMYILAQTGVYDPEADIRYVLDASKLRRVEAEEAGKQYLNLYLKRSASSVDILNPDVVDKFLTATHEAYREYLGEEFADLLCGFFTDEPQYYRWETPYTPMIATYYQNMYGEDIRDSLGLLFVEKEGYREFRYRYWCGMQKLMLEHYAKKIFDWCEKYHVKLTGHYVEEVSMGCQIMCCGGVMPFYQYMHIPGIDWLGGKTDYELAPRQVASVACQMEKEAVLTETFGCCGWDTSPAQLQRIAGFQYANGVNLMCHHLVPYKEHGQRKRDYPTHFSPINPWIEEHFGDFNRYFTVLGDLLRESKEMVKVAILHPVRSAYFDYKRELEQDGFGIAEMDAQLKEDCRRFSARGVAYHFLDETLLEEHGFVEDGKIGCGACTYEYLVLPHVRTMGNKTEALLRSLLEQDGKVLILGGKPDYLEGQKFDYPYLHSTCDMQEILATQPFGVSETDTELYYTYHVWENEPFVFVQNASDTTSYRQTFTFADGCKAFREVDLLTGESRIVPLTVTIPENASKLLLPISEKEAEVIEAEEIEWQFQDAEVSFEENYLTVDTLRYSKDGIEYSERMLRSQAFQRLLEERYRGRLWIRYEFEVKKRPEKLILMAETGYMTMQRLNGVELTFPDVWDANAEFGRADITDLVQTGTNRYEVMLDWHQSEETYLALFGENVTDNLRNCIVYESELEAIYLCGRFGVYSLEGYEAYDETAVIGGGFYIGEVPTTVSEPTIEGFPFFRGDLTLRQNIQIEQTPGPLRVEGRYMAAKVWVNGQYAGTCLQERRLDISPFVKEGQNEITVTFTVGNRNLLGPFHCKKREEFVGPASFEWNQIPAGRGGHIRYKLYRFYAEKNKNKEETKI